MSLLKKKLAFMAVVNKVKGFVRSVVGIPPLTLPNAVGDDLLDYKIYGESKQNGTPSPEAPVEIVSVGDKTVNLFNKNDAESILTGYSDNTRFNASTNTRSVVIPCKENTKYTVSKILSARFSVGYTAEFPKQNTATLQLTSNNAATKITTISPSGAKYIVIYLYHFLYDTNITVEEVIDTLQIEEGDTATAYEPFGYKVPIKVIGKNLFDEQDFFKKACEIETLAGYEPEYLEIDGKVGLRLYGRTCGLGKPADGTRLGVYSGFKDNTQYTFSFDFYDITALDANGKEAYGAIIYCYYTDGTVNYNLFTADANMRSKNEWRHRTFTSAAGKTIMRINFTYATGIAQTYFANFQIEEGALETAYEPYKNLGTTNIYLAEPLRKAGEYADYIDFSNGCVVRKLDEMVFDGTENWLNNGNDVVYLAWMNNDGSYTYAGVPNCISTHLPNADTVLEGEIYFRPTSSVLRIYRKGTGQKYTDNEGFKAFLAEEYAKGNPVTLITPYMDTAIKTEPIELPTIPTAKGTTILIADTTTQPSNMDVTYYSSI